MSNTKRRFESGERLLDMRKAILALNRSQDVTEDEYEAIIELQKIFSGYPTALDESKISKLSGVPQSVVRSIMGIHERPELYGETTHKVSISDILKIINGLLSDLVYDDPPSEPRQPLQDASDAKILRELSKTVSSNGQVIRMISADLVKQIDEYLESLRKKNDIDPDLRDNLSGFLVTHRENLVSLALSVPTESDTEAKEIEQTATYLARYLEHIKKFASEQTSPENLAKLTLPTGIVLLSGAVGAAFGQPLVGLGFGAWLTGKLSPDKLATQVLKSSAAPDE